MTFHYTDEDGDQVVVRPGIRVPFVVINTGPNGCFIPLDKVEELVAGIRDMARQAAASQPVVACPGFPDQCPHLTAVEPAPPAHYGGVRCGCGDKPAVPAQRGEG